MWNCEFSSSSRLFSFFYDSCSCTFCRHCCLLYRRDYVPACIVTLSREIRYQSFFVCLPDSGSEVLLHREVYKDLPIFNRRTRNAKLFWCFSAGMLVQHILHNQHFKFFCEKFFSVDEYERFCYSIQDIIIIEKFICGCYDIWHTNW